MAAMQLVTPRLVAMAVRMAMAVWMINFQVSFLFADMIGNDFFESLMKMMNSSYAPLVAGGEIPRACFREAVGPGEGG